MVGESPGNAEAAMERVAIDTGGTFTDCVMLREGKLVALKVFSTPRDPGESVLNGLRELGVRGAVVVRHGTTVGTNAMLERKGARVAFVTTAGFEDTIAIGRQARAKLYDWFQPAPVCLVPAGLRFGVEERTSAEGERLRVPSKEQLKRLVERVRAAGVDAIALSLLFSFANDANERTVAAALDGLGLPLSLSHKILPEFREYERGSTVVANAYLAPLVGRYLGKLAGAIEGEASSCAISWSRLGSRLEVMQSSGGIISARVAAEEPVRTVLSGPAGGVVGAYKLASAAGFERIIGFDMGGTSTDVCLVDAGAGGLRISNESVVSGVPLGVPMLDIHTAGAGGGSLARFDAGGMLRVGPESAGAMPGPICYGRGELPTVTDANLILGRLDTESFLGGAVKLDLERTRHFMEQAKGPLASVEAFAAGILRVIETEMAKAIRVISIERGFDPRDFALVAFGGGGPVHACALARALRVPRVLVPMLPGALSAVGILLADTMREYSRTVMLPLGAEIDAVFTEMERGGREEFEREGLEGVSQRSCDLRYRGQGYELNVPFGKSMAEEFHRLHERRYGFASAERPVEIVNVRVRMVAPAPAFEQMREKVHEGDGGHALVSTRDVYFEGEWVATGVYDRERLRAGDVFVGPAIVTEYSSATVVPRGDVLRVDELRNLVIEVRA
ncbi:hydantoinase/oxoprolinase family protein [Occallatibacter riparius]|uniref:Hydantoinase/oxoprolinase family protein n=1 Tax=Occallatibacter riparius TaxID=1002689 RepID=A0A9J7BM28_9BACT|nr:hydantoinase/oxoprolinase family protein [Occallatibacter riparius]UWZ83940.1 hydantoinase/oxoprolinase family protein [Occallatibacter riparius]